MDHSESSAETSADVDVVSSPVMQKSFHRHRPAKIEHCLGVRNENPDPF